MKNLMAAMAKTQDKIEELTVGLQAQIDNSLEIGWQAKDILIVTNFPMEYLGVKAIHDEYESNKHCLTGAKMFATYFAIKHLGVKEAIWAHDLDVWQNIWFDQPQIKDCGFSCYSDGKINGGSAFWNPSAIDLITEICGKISNEKREEPTINKVIKSEKKRWTKLNETYNVGCSAYSVRYERADKPIKCCHFHPTNRIAVQTHLLNRDGLGYVSVTPRLERLLRKHYPTMAVELDSEGRAAQSRKIAKRGNSVTVPLPPKEDTPIETEIVSMPEVPPQGGYTQTPKFIID